MIKPYLMFNRQCKEAFEMYQEAFDGEILLMQTYSEIPPDPQFTVDEKDKDLVLHAQLRVTESGFIMGADSQRKTENGSALSISVEFDSEKQARKAWDALKSGGEVLMDLQPSFFAKLHGSVTDQYGFTWMFTVV